MISLIKAIVEGGRHRDSFDCLSFILKYLVYGQATQKGRLEQRWSQGMIVP